MNGQSRAVDIDLGAPDFAEGAGSMEVISALPLGNRYHTTFYNVDLQKMQPRIMQPTVAGSEKVTVPAGTFDAYKVELTPVEAGTDRVTIWVAKDEREPVKYSAVLASMGRYRDGEAAVGARSGTRLECELTRGGSGIPGKSRESVACPRIKRPLLFSI